MKILNWIWDATAWIIDTISFVMPVFLLFVLIDAYDDGKPVQTLIVYGFLAIYFQQESHHKEKMNK